jgi:outer membrane protein TolC
MAKRVSLLWLVILMLVPALAAQAQSSPSSLKLSLQECLAKAMKNNLGVQVQMLNPELREVAVTQANERFMPSLSLNFGRNNQQSASYNVYDAADVSTTEFDSFSGTINQELPGGGSLSLRLNGSKYDTNRPGNTFNPSYRAEMRFSFDQPLLRNFGLNISRREIIVAKTRLEMSDRDLERALQVTVYEVEQAYWNLVYAVENYKATQQSLRYAQDLLERNRRSVEVGTMAPINIISAEAEVASREADLLVAEAEIKNQEDRIKQIMNLRAEDPQADLIQIEPLDQPKEDYVEISLDEALATALQNRPDLASSQLGIKTSEMDLSYAKNQTLPDLSFSASYWSPGVSGTEILYDRTGPNPLNWPIIGKNEEGLGESLKDVFGLEFPNWSVGLNLNFALSSILTRSAVAQAQVTLEQALLQLQEQEIQIYTDIKIAVRNVETRHKQHQALKVSRQLYEKQLEAVTEKLKVGLATNFEVLQYQRDLALQIRSELQALINYNMSLAQLERDMGISLDKKNVSIAEAEGSRVASVGLH